MNYNYNIKVNLKDKLINFYEWESKDKITILKKVPIFKVNEKSYEEIINKKIKVEKDFLNKISLSNNTCIFCSDIDTIGIKFNNEGLKDKISKLDLVEEKEILDEMLNKQKSKIKYTIISNENTYSYKTRKEIRIINNIVGYIEKEKNNNDLIDYLYYEWFNKNTNKKDKYVELIKSIKENYTEKHNNFYKIIVEINS